MTLDPATTLTIFCLQSYRNKQQNRRCRRYKQNCVGVNNSNGIFFFFSFIFWVWPVWPNPLLGHLFWSCRHSFHVNKKVKSMLASWKVRGEKNRKEETLEWKKKKKLKEWKRIANCGSFVCVYLLPVSQVPDHRGVYTRQTYTPYNKWTVEHWKSKRMGIKERRRAARHTRTTGRPGYIICSRNIIDERIAHHHPRRRKKTWPNKIGDALVAPRKWWNAPTR